MWYCKECGNKNINQVCSVCGRGYIPDVLKSVYSKPAPDAKILNAHGANHGSIVNQPVIHMPMMIPSMYPIHDIETKAEEHSQKKSLLMSFLILGCNIWLWLGIVIVTTIFMFFVYIFLKAFVI